MTRIRIEFLILSLFFSEVFKVFPKLEAPVLTSKHHRQILIELESGQGQVMIVLGKNRITRVR